MSQWAMKRNGFKWFEKALQALSQVCLYDDRKPLVATFPLPKCFHSSHSDVKAQIVVPFERIES